MGKLIVWTSYPKRTCMTLHECRICGQLIRAGQEYRDGGYGRRAHEKCVSARVDDLAGQPRWTNGGV